MGKFIQVAGNEAMKLTASPHGAEKHADENTQRCPNGDGAEPSTGQLEQLIDSITRDRN